MKHPFTIEEAPGEFDDVRANPNTAHWKRQLAANPKPKYTKTDTFVAIVVSMCSLGIVAIFVYLWVRWH